MSKIRFVFLSLLVMLGVSLSANAQLRKSSETERIKAFTNGSVTLFKSTTDMGEVYSVKLPNASKYHSDVILFLGSKEVMLKNLNDLYEALECGKKGESFTFTACGQNYHLSYDKVIGQVCFRVCEEYSTNYDFGRFYQATISDIIEYFNQ